MIWLLAMAAGLAFGQDLAPVVVPVVADPAAAAGLDVGTVGGSAGTIGGLVATVLMLERLGVIHLPRRGGEQAGGVNRADFDALAGRVDAQAAASATVGEMPTRLAVVEAQLSALQERHDDLRQTTRDALSDARSEMRRAVERARAATATG